MNGGKLLALLTLAFINMAFPMAIVHNRFHPQWIASYDAILLLYSALHFRRSTDLPEPLRRCLGKAAAALALFLSSSFFCNVAADMPWWIAVAVWLGLAVAAYFSYEVITFDAAEEEQFIHQVRVRLPV